jgi:hypothetical protein
MLLVTIPQILERLQKLPPNKLPVVYDFISYLADRSASSAVEGIELDAFQTMLASEAILSRDWNRPEEDQAWADL